MFQFITKLFDSNEKQLKLAKPIIEKINTYGEELKSLSDEQLRAKTEEFRKRLNVDLSTARHENVDFRDVSKESRRSIIENEKAELLSILPEAFAVVREASDRVASHKHYDVQLLAGYFLFTNKIVELFTGEGKTLAANLPLYLYALTGKGAHLVTVNDYLARRDAEWNGHILASLGISVAAVNNDTQYKFISDADAIKYKGEEGKKLLAQRDELAKKNGRLKYDHMTGVNLIECTKKEAYACDVVYGTNNEFGFDYLRDNMSRDISDRVQGPLHFAIVDEADSILIDEARTPLIISQSADISNELYTRFASVVANLEENVDYTIDEKSHSVVATDKGLAKAEKMMNVQNIYENSTFAYHLDNALKAKGLYHRDDEYIIRDGEILIVDEFTGRVLPGRRYSEGLHQAIEAKEGVEIKRESKTLATITLQNYFRLYDHLAGMTGTALTEAEEFASIYKLDVIVVPTNRPVVRKDNSDMVYRTHDAKFRAIVEDIKERHEIGQPILVGTASVEKSEILSEMLSKEGVPHNVLNAKQHEKESKIVSEAGKKGMVTIATNMAGRGTDIALGEGVKEVGGLYIIGSERHESRRIDNQLRGRSGRQGDPGESRFYVSFEDELMRIFGGDNMKMLMGRIGMDDEMPIASGILGKTIETAQKRVEAYNYDIRKHLVDYDDVLNQQREIIYGMRRRILSLLEEEKVSKADERIKKDADSKGEGNPSNRGDSDSEKSEPTKSDDQDEKIQIDPAMIQKIDIEKVEAGVDRFSIRNRDTYYIDELAPFKGVNKPLNNYVLKKIFDYTRNIFSAQMADDMSLDNSETRTTIALIQAFLSEDLTEVSAKLLGYGDSIEFFKEFDKIQSNAVKQSMLLRLVTAGYIFHVMVVGEEAMVELCRMLVLQVLDSSWMEHLDTMQDVREGISLRNLAQRDPLVEYKNEGFRLFDELLANVDNSIVSRFFKVRVVRQEQVVAKEVKQEAPSIIGNRGEDKRPGQVGGQAQVKNMKKVGRNDPCPCGSGKKYKKCCYPKYG